MKIVVEFVGSQTGIVGILLVCVTYCIIEAIKKGRKLRVGMRKIKKTKQQTKFCEIKVDSDSTPKRNKNK